MGSKVALSLSLWLKVEAWVEGGGVDWWIGVGCSLFQRGSVERRRLLSLSHTHTELASVDQCLEVGFGLMGGSGVGLSHHGGDLLSLSLSLSLPMNQDSMVEMWLIGVGLMWV